MQPVRIQLNVEIEQRGNGLAIRSPKPLSLIHARKQWTAASDDLPIELGPFASLEEAILAGARALQDEMQAQVIERPMIAGRITPQNIPLDMFQ